ncbi:hypothetical protein ACWEN6_36575 [Sphaerisporangium sp. NPDC004334]
MTRDTESLRHELTDLIVKAVQKGDQDRVDDLAEEMWMAARRDGMKDLLIDLWDAKEITPDAIENNGVADPRDTGAGA